MYYWYVWSTRALHTSIHFLRKWVNKTIEKADISDRFWTCLIIKNVYFFWPANKETTSLNGLSLPLTPVSKQATAVNGTKKSLYWSVRLLYIAFEIPHCWSVQFGKRTHLSLLTMHWFKGAINKTYFVKWINSLNQTGWS